MSDLALEAENLRLVLEIEDWRDRLRARVTALERERDALDYEVVQMYEAVLALGDALAVACKSATRRHDQEHVSVERNSWAEIQDAALAFQIERDRILDAGGA